MLQTRVGKRTAAAAFVIACQLLDEGRIDADEALRRVTGAQLVRRETNPDDLDGIIAAQGVLTSRGGRTSHAAVVARGMGKTCVCGAEELEVDTKARRMTVGSTVVEEGDV